MLAFEEPSKEETEPVQILQNEDTVPEEDQSSDENDFLPAFASSVAMILVSEIGDKTFFIAAIMAMRHSRLTVFTGAILALALMTVLSAALGHAAPKLLPKNVTHTVATILFFVFGLRSLKDAYSMSPDEMGSELEEVEAELGKKEEDMGADEEDPRPEKKNKKTHMIDPVLVQCFSLTFLAEWGDRSQIATIALAAAKDAFGVTLGGILGHSVCTGVAVIGGRLLATRISERQVLFAGGLLFLGFGISSFLYGA